MFKQVRLNTEKGAASAKVVAQNEADRRVPRTLNSNFCHEDDADQMRLDDLNLHGPGSFVLSLTTPENAESALSASHLIQPLLRQLQVDKCLPQWQLLIITDG